MADLIEPGAADNYTWSRDSNSWRSMAISLKRIADCLEGDKDSGTFLQRLFNTLEDASHNHSQRIR